MFLRLVLCFGVALMLAGAAAADVPQLINYQGILLDTAGDPVTTPTLVLFAIWNADFDGDSLWSEEQSVTPDDIGRFAVLLGAVSPIPDSAFAGAETYLSVKVDTDPEMIPRQCFASVAYAYHGANADGALYADSTDAITDGGVDFADIGQNEATENQIMKWNGAVWAAADDQTGTGGWVDDGTVVRLETITDSVGIGITSPDANLHVEGTLHVTDKGSFGPDNSNPGVYSFVAGSADTAGGNYSTVGGGQMNVAGATLSTIGGGNINRVSNEYGTIGGGSENEVAGFAGTIAGGRGNTASYSYATVGGGYVNTASGSLATVGGGGNNKARNSFSVVAGGGSFYSFDSNSALGHGSAILGGTGNIASGDSSTIGGGSRNTASGETATISGGWGNTASGNRATVGGGTLNTVSGYAATVSGGWDNTASGDRATVGGGHNNTASDYSTTVGGGQNNSASLYYASVGGGVINTASGYGATIPGGYWNEASGQFSFAAGLRAKATNAGAFVWADNNEFDFPKVTESNFTPAAKMFLVRSTGGAVFVSGIDGSGNSNAGVQLAAGGGSWSSLSDRNLKENFEQVDGADVLARIATLPISTWNYKAQDESIRHLGPMAQDVYAAFAIGEDDRHITTIDGNGIALAAIQGLHQENVDLKKRVERLEALVKQMLKDKE